MDLSDPSLCEARVAEIHRKDWRISTSFEGISRAPRMPHLQGTAGVESRHRCLRTRDKEEVGVAVVIPR